MEELVRWPLNIDTHIENYRKKSNRITTKKTNWEEYQNAVGYWIKEKRGVDNCREEAGMEQKYEEFIEITEGAIGRITPRNLNNKIIGKNIGKEERKG
ncbi:4 -phosphopantetheinyl transferase [Lasius niger]|uniref:4-phosphopantetheinyl transferase n=1 Tax=Lasius niger TaxID=67767 RepID=A0A0J7KN17_LASNI|nr:4 -phosphopantetheinyl transferase [Lasius niger]